MSSPPSAASPARPGFRRWGWFALAAAAFGLLLFWAARTTGVGPMMDRVVGELRTMGAPVFFSAMALLPAVGFPLLPFALAAGPVFTPILGAGGVIACAVLAVGLNVALSYLLAATLFRPPVQWLVRRFGSQLPDPGRHSAWLITLLVRVAPGPPFWVQSYALGLVRVRFGPYVIVSTLVPAGYLTGAILAGDAMLQGKPRAALLAAGIALLAGTAIHLIRRHLLARAARRPETAAVPPALAGETER